MLEDIENPPFPGEGTTAQGLYNCLKELRKWTLFYRDDLNKAVGQEVIPSVMELPNKGSYTSQPVFTQYQHFMLLRKIRERWDVLIRDYENDWVCQQSVRGRAMLVQVSATLLNGAFVPFEVREAKSNQYMESMLLSFDRLATFFRKSIEPEASDGEATWRRKKPPTPVEEDPFAFVDEEVITPRKKVKEPKEPREVPLKSWPDEVPVLTAAALAWDGDMGPERKSVDWWLYWTFSHLPPRKGSYSDDKANAELCRVIGERRGKPVKCLGSFMLRVSVSKAPSLAWQAACWNEAMRSLGYEVPGKLCKDPGV